MYLRFTSKSYSGKLNVYEMKNDLTQGRCVFNTNNNTLDNHWRNFSFDEESLAYWRRWYDIDVLTEDEFVLELI